MAHVMRLAAVAGDQERLAFDEMRGLLLLIAFSRAKTNEGDAHISGESTTIQGKRRADQSGAIPNVSNPLAIRR